jgi:tRNA (guanosine-2'-O-)-methyltransferase
LIQLVGAWAHFLLEESDRGLENLLWQAHRKILRLGTLLQMAEPEANPGKRKTIRSKTEVRRLHKETKEQYRSSRQIAFLLQDWSDAYNVGGMFRVADACGASEIILGGRTPLPDHPQVAVTSLGHHRRIAWRHIDRNEEAAAQLVKDGYTLVAVEIAEGATPYFELEYGDKVCLVLGNEVNGVYGAVMKHCSAAVYIPMFGKGRSMNVHVSAAVVGYHLALNKG